MTACMNRRCIPRWTPRRRSPADHLWRSGPRAGHSCRYAYSRERSAQGWGFRRTVRRLPTRSRPPRRQGRSQDRGNRIHRLDPAECRTQCRRHRPQQLPAPTLPRQTGEVPRLETLGSADIDRGARRHLVVQVRRGRRYSGRIESRHPERPVQPGMRAVPVPAGRSCETGDGAGVNAVIADIVDNPKKLTFIELDAANCHARSTTSQPRGFQQLRQSCRT